MTGRRFAAKTTREALAAVRAELGGDAVVLASRDHPLGVELVACRAAELDAPAGAGPTQPGMARSDPTQPDPARPDPPVLAEAAPGGGSRILAELSRLTALVQNQLAGFAWGEARRRDPARVAVLQQLYAAGFGGVLARGLAARLPRGQGSDAAERWLRAALVRNLPLAGAGLFEAGRVALVGATGAGKTTTLAKLAARAARAHGAGHVALVATDRYRLAATEQLAAYAGLLGVELVVAHDPGELGGTLARLKQKLVLIDTAGFNPVDPRVDGLAELDRLGVRRVLLLPAVQQGAALELAMTRFGAGAVAAIVSKLDEAPQTGAALDVLIRHRVPLAALATGQRVPEDLHPPNAAYLVDRALRGGRHASPFALVDEDWALFHGAEAERDDGDARVA